MRLRSAAQDKIDLGEGLFREVNDALDYLDLAVAENDDDVLRDVQKQADAIEAKVKKSELARMLSGPVDHANAIVSVHPGTGGTEAKDWAEMLLRMYLRWAERRGFKTEIIDYQAGDEAGIDGASFIVNGQNA